MEVVRAIKRYEMRQTPSARYLLVPGCDYSDLYGDDPYAGSRAWSLGGLYLTLCAWLEESYAMQAFLRRAKRVGWDVDWVTIEAEAEEWELA